jgi:hypothetical protein
MAFIVFPYRSPDEFGTVRVFSILNPLVNLNKLNLGD